MVSAVALRESATKLVWSSFFYVLAFVFFFSSAVYAACTGPAGSTGEMVYNQDHYAIQYCDGTNWNMIAQGRNCFGPPSCLDVGDQCADSTIFAGCHPIYNSRMFIHPNDQGTVVWSTGTGLTTAIDRVNGRFNQNEIETGYTITDFKSFELCYNLNQASALGYDDWYLPSRAEMFYFWVHLDALNAGPGDDFVTADAYWTSTDRGTLNAFIQWMDAVGSPTHSSKTNTLNKKAVRCMRRD